MPEPPYRALRIVLRVFSLLAALGGLLMIFAEKPLIVRIFLRPPEGEVVCPHCGSKEIEQRWSAFSVITSKKSA